jgi:hypothetical protein
MKNKIQMPYESIAELRKAALLPLSQCYNLENRDFNFKYMKHF